MHILFDFWTTNSSLKYAAVFFALVPTSPKKKSLFCHWLSITNLFLILKRHIPCRSIHFQQNILFSSTSIFSSLIPIYFSAITSVIFLEFFVDSMYEFDTTSSFEFSVEIFYLCCTFAVSFWILLIVKFTPLVHFFQHNIFLNTNCVYIPF